jgi:hypothetical protein
MDSASLLIFNGGATLHSMFPAWGDPHCDRAGIDFRVSLLFRWTTDAMREFGTGDKARKAGHDKQYREDRRLPQRLD